MNPFPVKEMEKSPAGRKRLARVRRAHKLDILQPGDPLFEKVYGKQVQAQKKRLEKQEQLVAEEHKEVAERKKYDKKN